jgi:hypothetical protein
VQRDGIGVGNQPATSGGTKALMMVVMVMIVPGSGGGVVIRRILILSRLWNVGVMIRGMVARASLGGRAAVTGLRIGAIDCDRSGTVVG